MCGTITDSCLAPKKRDLKTFCSIHTYLLLNARHHYNKWQGCSGGSASIVLQSHIVACQRQQKRGLRILGSIHTSLSPSASGPLKQVKGDCYDGQASVTITVSCLVTSLKSRSLKHSVLSIHPFL